MPSFSPRKKRLFLATATLAASARAASVTLVASDPAATSSFNSANTPPATGWSDGLAPAAGNAYFTGAFLLRTPVTGPATFAGDSLSIDTGGTLLLKGTGNSWTINNLILNGGGITQGDDTANPTTTTLIGGLNLAANSTIDVGGGGTNRRNITLNSTVSGSGTLTVNNSGSDVLSTLTLGGTAANTNSGLLTVNGGVLTLAKTAGLNATAGDITLNNAARINWTNPNQIPDTATLTLNGTALLNRSGTSPADTIATLNLNTTAQSVLSGLTVSGATTITAGIQHDLSSGASFTTGTLAMSGGSVVRLGANSAASTLTIGAGGLTLTGSTLQIGQAGGAFLGRINLGGNITASGTSAISNPNTLGARELDLGGATRTVDVAAAGTLTISPTVQNGGINKTGGGTLVLSGPNTMGTGTLTFGSGTTNSGAIRLASASALGGYTAVNLPANNTGISVIELTGGVTFNTVNLTTAGRSNAQTTGATLVNVSGNNTWPGSVTINTTGGAYAIRSDAGTLTLSGGLVNGIASTRTWDLGGTGDITVSGVISETSTALSINKFGTGALTLSNTGNSYTGTTTAGTGTLRLGAANVIPDGTGKGNVVVNGTLDLNTFSETINGLTGTGTIDTVAGGTPTLTVGGNNQTSSFGGVIQDTAGTLTLAKTGTGTLTLTGTNAHAGPTQVNAGILAISNNAALGTTAGATTVAANASLALGAVTVTGETVTINGSGDNFNGALRATSNATWAGPVILGDINARLGAAAATTLTVSGAVTGANPLYISGASGTGAVVLSAAAGQNTYSGNTSVIRGVLKLGADNTLPTTTVLDVDFGAATEDATFDLNGFNQTIGALQRTGTGSGASFVTNSGGALKTLTVNQSGNTSYDGVISGAANLALTKSGAGTLTLAGANTYTGATTVNGGTLALSGGAALADGSPVTLANTAGAVLLLNAAETVGSLAGGGTTGGGVNLQSFTLTIGGDGTSTSYSGAISGTGALTKIGAGIQTLAGSAANTFTGITTVSAGTLTLGKTAGVNAVSGTVNVTGGALSRTVANQIPDTAVVTTSGTGILSGAQAETIGTLNINSTGANILSGLNVTGTTTITAGTTHDINSGSSFTTGTLAMSGSSVLRMGNNTAATTVNIGAGGLTLSGATLQMGQPGGVGTGLINLGGNVTASGTSAVSVPNLNGLRLLDLGAATRTVDVATGGALTLAPVIQNGALNKTGAGSLTLSGANTYAGATKVFGGTVFAASSSAFGSTAGGTTVDTGATVQTSGASGLSFAENFTLGGGTLRAGGNPAVDPELTGNLTLTSSSLLQADGNTAWTVSGAVNTGPAASTLTVQQDGSGTTEISGVIGGSGSLAKINGGTLVLSNPANTYTGKTAVNGGVLRVDTGSEATLGAPAAAPDALSLNSGTLRITSASLTLDDAGRGVTVAGAGTADVASGFTLALGNFVEGTGAAFTKASAGTVDITAGAKFSSFNVAGGRLRQSAGTVTAANGVVGLSGTYQLTGGTLRVDSMTVAGGFEWSNAVLTHNTTNTGNPIGTDVSSPGYQNVGVGNTATITGNLTTGAGSVLALHSSPTLYLSGGVRFNGFHVTGDLNLGGSGDVLELELNPYLLRPFAQLGPAVFETGSLPLVTWDGARTDEFDVLAGVLNDGRGFDLSAFPVSDPTLLAGDTYWLEYDDAAQTIWLHYKVSGYVPEPGSFGLLAAGTLALRLARTLQDRRRRLNPSA